MPFAESVLKPGGTEDILGSPLGRWSLPQVGRTCLKSVVSFSALGQQGHSEALAKPFVNPDSCWKCVLEMCAIRGKHIAIVIMLFLSKRAARVPAGKGRGFLQCLAERQQDGAESWPG